MQKTCRTDAAHYYLFLLIHAAAKIRIVQSLEFRVRSQPTTNNSYICLMEVTDTMIEKLAHLARLEFNDAEKEEIKYDLQRMIAFVEKLNELDLEGVEPLTHMSDEVNVLREDKVEGSISRDDALKNAPLHDEQFFKVPKVIKPPSPKGG
jgi:aspartyl-tRNA(Asn)/glutamyl-tRNA(Gln) amidotransferase subunit C